jgi:RNA polymerase sigma factor (sigma-70 family)
VATNLAKDARKTAQRRGELARLARGESTTVAPADPGDLLERAEVRRRVRAALDGLSHKERTALLLREEGFAHREIAAAVGTTTGSVGTLVARALTKLARLLEPERAEGGN